MQLNVPFYSQHTETSDESWKPRACALTCLKMVMEFFGTHEKLIIDNLIKEGVEIGAYQENVGWIHAGLTRIAHNHGFTAYNEEFRSRNVETEKYLLEKAILKIKKKIGNNFPVIVSCSKNWDEVDKYHQVVITGYDDAGFYYHEPNSIDSEGGAHRLVSYESFRNHWRKFAIFLEK